MEKKTIQKKMIIFQWLKNEKGAVIKNVCLKTNKI